mmetsp:Transcript_15786/g.44182  ORF Transcript_15786/g.44182 Transcript_15786/m.44182 type:complete len:147 (-) Transcript_15786:133-573(-)
MVSQPPGRGRARQVKTSVSLEVFFYFGGIYDVVWWIAELCVFIYKGISLPYPTNSYAVEFTFLWLYLLVEPVRLFLGSKGNKTESVQPLSFSLLCSLPVIALHIYLMLFQTFVLRLELIMNGAALVFIGFQVLISVVKIPSFVSKR